MKERIIRFLSGRWIPFFVLVLFLYSLSAEAQTKYLLPLGNSITWGKSEQSAPPPGQHGYRDHLYNDIHSYGSYTIDFVGGRDDGQLGELAAVIAPLLHADEDLAALRLQAAGGNIHRGAAQAGG